MNQTFIAWSRKLSLLSQYQGLPPSVMFKKKKIRAASYIFEWWQDYCNAERVLEGITKNGAPQTGKDEYYYTLGQGAPGAGLSSTLSHAPAPLL